ncbi:uncharacterized protein LOC134024804 [Osmerus eperlanus]|uniref:uncharacterized protein LOC134024804 n=1 Tax=Osmerus eperlanus TaxID=29151 RepID=UPI002E12294C
MEVVVVKLEDDEEERPCTQISPEKEGDEQFLANTIRSIKTQTQDNTCLESNTSENVKIEHDVELGNIGDNKAIWRRRSTLVNEIFSKVTSRKRKLEENMRCKKIGLDVDVGSGPKPKLDLQLLTNGVMKEIAEFAKELSTHSQKHYIAEILEYNFHIGFENSKQRREFAHQTWQRVVEMQKRLKQYPDDLSMLNEPWMLSIHPYYMFPKTSSQTDPIRDSGIKSEHLGYAEICVKSESDMTANQDIKVEAFYTVPEETKADLYPLCQEIGLDLDVTYKGWSKEKLDKDVLTKGVMIEVAKYTKELCGTYRQIVFDILEHNFDLDLQAVDSELFRSIIFSISLIGMKKNRNRNLRAWHETAFSVHIYKKKDPKLAPAVSKRQSERQKRQLSAADCDKKKREAETQSAGMSERNFKKRTCKFSSFERTDRYNDETADVDQIDDQGYMCSLENPGLEPSLTVLCAADGGHVSSPAPLLTPSYDTHTALCAEKVKLQDIYMRPRLDYYPFCEQSGIDLDVYSKLESKEKHHLQVLTNGVMFEIHKYVRRNRKKKAYSRFIYDILEYNFDMSFHNLKWYSFINRIVWYVKKLAATYRRDVAINPNHTTEVFALHSKIPTEKKRKETVPQPARTSERIFKKKTCKLSNFERTNPCTDGTADFGQIDDLGYMCSLENPGLEPLLTDQANMSHIKKESH